MHAAQKPGEGSALTRQVLKEFAGLHHQLTEVAGVKVRVGSATNSRCLCCLPSQLSQQKLPCCFGSQPGGGAGAFCALPHCASAANISAKLSGRVLTGDFLCATLAMSCVGTVLPAVSHDRHRHVLMPPHVLLYLITRRSRCTSTASHMAHPMRASQTTGSPPTPRCVHNLFLKVGWHRCWPSEPEKPKEVAGSIVTP